MNLFLIEFILFIDKLVSFLSKLFDFFVKDRVVEVENKRIEEGEVTTKIGERFGCFGEKGIRFDKMRIKFGSLFCQIGEDSVNFFAIRVGSESGRMLRELHVLDRVKNRIEQGLIALSFRSDMSRRRVSICGVGHLLRRDSRPRRSSAKSSDPALRRRGGPDESGER